MPSGERAATEALADNISLSPALTDTSFSASSTTFFALSAASAALEANWLASWSAVPLLSFDGQSSGVLGQSNRLVVVALDRPKYPQDEVALAASRGVEIHRLCMRLPVWTIA